MLFFNRLVAVVGIVALLGPMLPLEARTRKGDRYLAEGRKHEDKREWDAAVECYEQALSTDPSEMVYQMAATKARFQAGAMHQDQGMKLRSQGKLGEALLEFQKAFALDPSSSVAEQEIVRTQEMIQRERQKVLETGKETPPEERGLTPIEEARKEAEDRIDRILPVPELRPLNPLPRNLKLNGTTAKVLYETVAKIAGINIVWDPDFQNPSKNSLNVDLDNTTLEQALDDIALQTKSFWKPLSANTIFVTNDTQTKHHDFDDQVTQIFYLSNINVPQQIQEIVNVVRSVTELQRITAFNAQNAIVVRGEADKVALAEAVIHDLDKPAPEVQVDIMVLETDSVFDRQLSAAIATGGLNVPINFSPRSSIQVPTSSTASSTTTTTTSTTSTTTTPTTTTGSTSTTPGAPIPLSNVGHLSSSDFSVVLPNALLQATLSDTKTKVLQAPQLRTVDNVKAELKIGQREPTASGSYQPGVAGVGVNPLVNTQFTYIDVGVNVNLTAHVHDNGDISLHIELDISNIAGTVNLGGINEPIIGQRKVTHDIRLREGEVNLIAGLIDTTDSKQVTGIPGLSSIPLLGYLFKGDSVDKERDEIMIAVVPHIIRRPTITAENLSPKAVGNQTTVKLRYAPLPGEEPAAAPAAAAPAPAPGGAVAGTIPASGAAAAPPETAPPGAPGGALMPPATAPPIPGTPGAPGGPPTAAAAPNLPPSAPASVHFTPGQIDTSPSGVFTVGLAVDHADDLQSAQIQVQFDPKVLQLTSVAPGGLLEVDGQQPTLTKNVMNESGSATIEMLRTPGTPGVRASGLLCTLHFQAVGKGAATITVPSLLLRNSQGQVIGKGTPQVAVTVK
ncbi:MAG TPA: cohesin domain-containing protein [Bryobacteraceae bacterium]|nr:cohesin domain-containing protein [Bryobacteraceae bacterium]